MELPELQALRRHRFKVAAAEAELGLSQKSRTLTNHLRGLCFKALSHRNWDEREAARLAAALFKNLPRDYRKYVEQAIERARST